MKRPLARLAAVLALAFCLAGCGAAGAEPPAASSASAATPPPAATAAPAASPETAAPAAPAGEETISDNEEEPEMKMNVQVGGATFPATLEQNAAVDALVERMRQALVTIEMQDFSGFEKVGALGASLPTADRRTTTRPGDIVLYQGDQIVLFYGTNAWSYTRLGHIDDLTGWADALGAGDVTVTFTLAE